MKNDVMIINEDSKGRLWSAKKVFYACLRAEKPLLPMLIPLFIIAILAKLFFDISAKISIFLNLFVFLPFVGPVGGAMAMFLFFILPNKWKFSEKGITIIGREFKTIKWDRIIEWSIVQVKDLKGFHILQVNYKAAKDSESYLVINPAYSIESIKEWLTSASTRNGR